ncbi:MAG: hypothetical protein ACR2QM_11280 [Longimicrobiales bacterium]
MSSEDLGALSKSQAVERFEEYDWGTELTWLGELEFAGAQRCPPGMGLVDTDPRILHLCPLSQTLLRAHYHFPARKGLGRWFGSRDTLTVESAPMEIAEDLILAFYRRRHEEFLAEVRRHQTSL